MQDKQIEKPGRVKPLLENHRAACQEARQQLHV